MTPRQWRLSVDVLADATLAASVVADDQLLMPRARFATPSEALAYLESVLVDFRRGDSLSTVLTVNGNEPRICLLSNRDSALSWLGPVLVDVWHRARAAAARLSSDEQADAFTLGPVTCTRRRLLAADPALEPTEELELDDTSGPALAAQADEHAE